MAGPALLALARPRHAQLSRRRPQGTAVYGSSMVTTTYIQAKPEDAHQKLRKVADCRRPKFDKAAEVMGLAEHDVLGFT